MSNFLYFSIIKFFAIAIHLLYSIFLARIINPEQYSLVVSGLLLFNLFEIIVSSGPLNSIITSEKITFSDYRALYKFFIYIGFFISLIFISVFFIVNKVNLFNVIIGVILAYSVLFDLISAVQTMWLYKISNTKKIANSILISNIISVLFVVTISFFYRSSLIVVFYYFSYSTSMFLMTYIKIDIRIEEKNSFESFSLISKEFFSLFFLSLNNFLFRNLEKFFILAFFSSLYLSYYEKAYKLMLYPLQFLLVTFSQLLMGFYSKNKNYLNKTQPRIFSDIFLIGTLFFNISIFLSFFSEPIVKILYGINWLQSSFDLSFLSFSLTFQALTIFLNYLFNSFNKTKKLFFPSIVGNFVLVVLLFLLKDLIQFPIIISLFYIVYFFALASYSLLEKILSLNQFLYLFFFSLFKLIFFTVVILNFDQINFFLILLITIENLISYILFYKIMKSNLISFYI
jgi:PST family polysaccharide transporter